MATRAWTALLLLAAFFTVHGLQCAVAPATHTEGGSSVTTLEAVSPRGPDGHTSAMVAAGQHTTALATVMMAGDLLPAGHGGTPAGPVGHLWTLCLAVLAAGLAALLTLLLPRPRTPPNPARAAPRARLLPAWPAPPRPPNLSALCLLRI